MALQISNMQKQQKNSTFTITKKVYIYKLDEIVDKYNNTVYCTIEILKEHSWRRGLSILFSILSIIVPVIIYSYIWNKIRKKRCFVKKGVPKTFAKFTGTPVPEPFFK